MKSLWSGFLFARPTFWEGVSRIMDLGGTLQEYNTSQSDPEADTRALRADWYAIGEDLKAAVRMVQAETSTQQDSDV